MVRFQAMSTLGSGAFGEVMLCKDTQTNQLVALKRINKFGQQGLLDYITSEVNIMQALNHKNVVKFIDAYEDPKNVYIIQEYCNGKNLDDYLKKCGILSEKQTAHIIRDICAGIYYLHENNIIHRDLKPQNIMIKYNESTNSDFLKGSDVIFKIGDFGLSKRLVFKNYATTVCGTEGYTAPEIPLQISCPAGPANAKYDNKVDIWSIGIIAFILLTGKLFDYRIHNLEAELNKTNLDNVTKDFLKNTINEDSIARYDIKKVCIHEFLTRGNHAGFEKCTENKNIIHQNVPLNSPHNNINNNSNQNINLVGLTDMAPVNKQLISQPSALTNMPPGVPAQGNNIITNQTMVFANGTFTGILDSQRSGRGRFAYNNGEVYEGEWILGKREGKGYFKFSSGEYRGTFKADKMHGKGVLNMYNGIIYEGEFLDGIPNGQGKYKDAFGNVNEGYFINGAFLRPKVDGSYEQVPLFKKQQ